MDIGGKYTLRPVLSVQFGSPSKIFFFFKKKGKMKKEGNKILGVEHIL